MIAIPEFKKLLGTLGERLTDDEVKRLYDMEIIIADAIFDQWVQETNNIKQKSSNKTPLEYNVKEAKQGEIKQI